MKRSISTRVGAIILLLILLVTFATPTAIVVEAAESDGGAVNITSVFVIDSGAIRQIKEDISAIRRSLDSYNPKVTVVRSINNIIDKAYYKPSIKDIPLLEEKISYEGGFASVYTGFFDLDKTDSYKPEYSQSRALEVLGYDFLLQDESYEYAGVADDGYKVERVEKNVQYGTVLMDIYKALGLSQYDVKVFYSADNSLDMQNNPVVKNLPSFIKSIDTSRGKTDVFITRTNRELYYDKAEKDLNITRNGMTRYMSNGDFIVLLTRMMHFYGEPVLSENEQNILLQVYGAEIPTYLNPAEQDAYLYLKSRGVLNVDLDYKDTLQLEDMLDILMCVYDKNSRTDYKQVQVTMNIGDDLINKGYFPRTVNLVTGKAAIEVSEEYDYSHSDHYDYYIEVTDKTKFVNINGDFIKYVFIPSILNDHESEELDYSTYLGVVTTDDGKSYYHFAISKQQGNLPIKGARPRAVGSNTDYFQINTKDGSDIPENIWFEKGGGVYTYSASASDGNVIVTERRPFQDGEFEGSVCKEREEEPKLSAFQSFINTIVDFLWQPQVAYAEPYDVLSIHYAHNTPRVTLTIENASNITGYAENIPNLEVEKQDDKLIVSLPSYYKTYFYSSIRRDTSEIEATAYPAISTMSGDILLKYNDLVEAGVFFNDADSLPKPEDYNDQILILNSKYGQVKINNETREIVVGNVLYKVKNDRTALFKYIIEDGETVLWVDFRAAYGWTDNIIDIIITGTGSSYTVNMQLTDTTNAGVIKEVTATPPSSFRTMAAGELMQIIPKGVLLDSKSSKAIMTSSYSLSNWILFQGIDRTTGTPKDYVFMFYPEKAFTNDNKPNDLERITDIVGYSVTTKGWACRVFELNRKPTDEIGKFTYSETFGYLYNMPTWKDFTLEKYLSGEYILPISEATDLGQIINANVNYFEGYPYGSRPTGNQTEGIDIKGEITSGSISSTAVSVISTAPAGVANLYGGAKKKAYSVDSDILAINQTKDNSSNVYYYGTSNCSITKNTAGEVYASMNFTGTNPWEVRWKVDNQQKFYLVKAWTTGNLNNAGVLQYSYKWVMYDDVLNKSISTVEAAKQDPLDIEVIDGEQKDKYGGFDGFSIEYLLSKIDYGSSWLIYFSIKILPLIGIIGVTILLGLSMVSNMKIVRLICSKTIDPVKLLTFGTMAIDQLYFSKAFLGLMLGYIGFALILDGNLLRIIQWVFEFYSVIVEMLKLL